MKLNCILKVRLIWTIYNSSIALHKAQTVWTKCNNSKCILHKFIVNQSYLIGGFFIVIFKIVLQKVLLV